MEMKLSVLLVSPCICDPRFSTTTTFNVHIYKEVPFSLEQIIYLVVLNDILAENMNEHKCV